MTSLNNEQAADYLHRSYAAVDGLWFMMAEEMLGFDTALELDEKVWQVMGKIQARKLKELLAAEDGLAGLCRCLTEKLRLDGFDFDVDEDDAGFAIQIRHCPWHALLEKAHREHLSSKIGARICPAEYRAWAGEFGDDITFTLQQGHCIGADRCRLQFGQT